MLNLQERPSLVFGDAVHVRFACMDDAEFVGYVIATEATLCMIAMPKQFYTCCVASPRTQTEISAVSTAVSLDHNPSAHIFNALIRTINPIGVQKSDWHHL